MIMHNGSARYLIFFQYLGTKYSGVMKAPPHQVVKGVQNYLEDAVRSLRPVNEVSLSISSRTDTGVHALGNSAHFDLQRQNGKPPFAEEVLVDALNFHLRPEPIRITRAYRVPGGFHARFRAVSRTYVYRLAAGVTHHSCTPLPDANLCWGLRHIDLDVGAMRDAAALLVGTHNFSSFRALNSETPFKDPVKTLEMASLELGDAFAHKHFHRDIQFWELTFKSRSFLYKQVRRMTGALVAVGQGQMSVSGVKELLEAQDSQAYPHNLTSPPEGLFLTRVEYHRSDLQLYTQEDSQS
ncbi:tRNA pseudouridine synthase-like 1 isoform X1 [Salmo salar]|uniref:tRNA pseudouridine synthase n=1 Tax=Salmo salar TaxID=8030 RepID=A0A1S3P8D0_SALSA|nr:tRNA pseudouridine synthase-like 1 isoform X1 [Salmo salar]|eukprot:XP_014023824.1 PREDICTED: tRNA pseudouridine synthase-like 1 isoform X1 [Salmo salar]